MIPLLCLLIRATMSHPCSLLPRSVAFMGPCGRAWGAGAFGWVVTMTEETAGDFRCDGDLLCNGVFGHVVDVLVCLCLARPGDLFVSTCSFSETLLHQTVKDQALMNQSEHPVFPALDGCWHPGLVCVFRDDIKILPTILRTHDLGVSRGTPKP